jgi:hypothetical protein
MSDLTVQIRNEVKDAIKLTTLIPSRDTRLRQSGHMFSTFARFTLFVRTRMSELVRSACLPYCLSCRQLPKLKRAGTAFVPV